MRVLIAEDEDQIAGAEAAFLKLKGFETDIAFNGEEVDPGRFFERFYQEEQSHTSKGKAKGFDIGLSTAQEIVSLFKGSISASYLEGRITFAVTLPRVSRKPSAADGQQT